MFWRGVAFWSGACSVLEGGDFFEAVLAVFRRAVAFLEGACSVLEGGDIFEAVLAVFRRGVAFLRRCLQCFGAL